MKLLIKILDRNWSAAFITMVALAAGLSYLSFKLKAVDAPASHPPVKITPAIAQEWRQLNDYEDLAQLHYSIYVNLIGQLKTADGKPMTVADLANYRVNLQTMELQWLEQPPQPTPPKK